MVWRNHDSRLYQVISPLSWVSWKIFTWPIQPFSHFLWFKASILLEMFDFLKATFFIDGRHSPGKRYRSGWLNTQGLWWIRVQHFCWMNLIFRTNHVCCHEKKQNTSLFDCWKSRFLMGSNSIDVTSGQSYHCFFSYKSPPWQASTKARGAIASISSWREALMEARSCRPGPSWRSWISWAYVWITTYQTNKSWIFVWIFDVI